MPPPEFAAVDGGAEVLGFRLGVGVGFLFDNNGDSGASLRLGGGLTFLANGPVGLAIDVALDVGRLSGYEVNQVQFAIGPEFHF